MKHVDLSKVVNLNHAYSTARQTRKQLEGTLAPSISSGGRVTIHNVSVDLTADGRRAVVRAIVDAITAQMESYRDQLHQLGVTEIEEG